MSMLCPRCDHKLDCINTRRQPSGIVRRAYKCRMCGGRSYSVEVTTSFKDMKNADRKALEDEKTKRAKARANLAAQILGAQGIEI